MKNLTGYLKKILFKYSLLGLFSIILVLLLSLFSLLTINPLLATDNFQISTNFEHTLTQDSVKTNVIMHIQSDSPRVISYYTATIDLEQLRVECTNFETRETLECTTFNRGSSTEILINLNNSVVRPDNPLQVLLSYNTPRGEDSTYNLTSQVYDTTTNSVLIRYPKELGEPLWTSDPVQNIRVVGENFEALINKPTYSRISLLFGEKLLYGFNINKVFSNTLGHENQTFELYVPTDTPTQTVIWEEISPLPNTALKDEDGNYIFKYIVEPEQTIDCNISGYIQKTESLGYDGTIRSFLTQKTGYWSINNNTEFRRINTFLIKKGLNIENSFDDVEGLEKNEKELFYKYIYQYVIDRLNLDKEVPLGIGVQPRLGANTLTDSPNKASSIDYADFYIALLRGYNVPSRLVVGYISNITGYTSDGFYHHWVEYLDTNTNKWVTADPFLEEYFEKNLFGSPFLDHLVILRRGKSAVAPKISFFQEIDFVVRSETEKDITPKFEVNSNLSFKGYKITDKFVKGYIHISNSGNIAINEYNISKSNIENILSYLDPVNNLQSTIVLPKQNNTIQFNIPYEEINSSNIFVNIQYSNLNTYKKNETLETKLEEITPLYLSLLSKALSVLIFGVFIFLIYFLVLTVRKILIKRKQNG